MDQCWKKSAVKMEEEVVDKYKVEKSKKRGLQRQRRSVGMEACTRKQKVQGTKVERRLLGKNLHLVQRVQPAVGKACMKQQIPDKKVGRGLLGKNLHLFQGSKPAASEKHA